MSCSRRRVSTYPCRRGIGYPEARWSIFARLRRVPPVPTSSSPARERPQPRRVQHLARVLAQAPHLPRRRRVRLQEGVRDPQGPERHADRPEQPPAPEAGHLQAAAAEVEEGPVVHRQAPDRPEEAVAGLLDARERADREAELAPDPPDERGTVRRVPQGRGARGHDPPHARSRARSSGSPAAPRTRARATPPGSRPVRSSSRTSRREARLPARMCRCPPASCGTPSRGRSSSRCRSPPPARRAARVARRLGTLRMAASTYPSTARRRHRSRASR